MNSYESDVSKTISENKKVAGKLEMSVLKYFWQASPFASSRRDNLPKFLRGLNVLKNFTDYELCILSGYLHLRRFDQGECVFKQGDIGVGLYFIYSGQVDLILFEEHDVTISLLREDYFGELALLQENSLRSATAYSKESSELLGMFRPDLEELIEHHPVVATKLLQAISIIIASRLFEVTKELRIARNKILKMSAGNQENEKQ